MSRVRARYQEAINHSTLALALARQAGWVEGESSSLGNLGAMHGSMGLLDG